MTFLRRAWRNKDPALWLALVRMVIGFHWLREGWEKVVDPQFAGQLEGTLALFAQDNPNGWYVAFLRGVAVPNSTVFAALVAYGELLVGLSLILGLFSCAGAFFGFLMNINFFLASSHLSPFAYGINMTMALVQAVLIVGGASNALGLDTLLCRRLLRLIPWWPESVPQRGGADSPQLVSDAHLKCSHQPSPCGRFDDPPLR